MVFVHGLSGHIDKTWTSKVSSSAVLWPTWLAEDVPGTGIWLLGYAAARTNWSGYSLPLSARADSILALLLAEPNLSNGNITFIAHSLGGLVVQQILRNAERDSGSNRKAYEFLSRVKRVAFPWYTPEGILSSNCRESLKGGDTNIRGHARSSLGQPVPYRPDLLVQKVQLG